MSHFSLKSFNSKGKDQDDADRFLEGNMSHMKALERKLLERTEDILPMDSGRMTLAELAKVCNSLHQTNTAAMVRMDQERHYGMYHDAVAKEWHEVVGASTATDNCDTQYPDLEKVLELDNETDATTPGTKASSSFEQKRKSTPPTPFTPPSVDQSRLR